MTPGWCKGLSKQQWQRRMDVSENGVTPIVCGIVNATFRDKFTNQCIPTISPLYSTSFLVGSNQLSPINPLESRLYHSTGRLNGARISLPSRPSGSGATGKQYSDAPDANLNTCDWVVVPPVREKHLDRGSMPSKIWAGCKNRTYTQTSCMTCLNKNATYYIFAV